MVEGDLRRRRPTSPELRPSYHFSVVKASGCIVRACSSVGLEHSSDKGVVPGSSPGRPTRSGDVAQMGERLPCTEEVRGSSPLISTEGRLTPTVSAV
jgi:hypothetical protein